MYIMLILIVFFEEEIIIKNRRSLKLFKKQLEESETIALISHENPDVDALSSLVALKNLIKDNYKNKKIDIFAQTKDINELLKPILKEDELNVQNVNSYDLAIGLDCPNSTRFGEYKKLFNNAKDTAQIDHHITNNIFAKNNLVYVTSSTTEIIYIIAKLMKFEISNKVCKLVYSGMITDTSNFMQGTKKKTTLKVLSDFYDRNVELDELTDYFFKNNSISKNKLLEKALHSMRFYHDGGLVLMKLTRQDFADAKAKFGDEEGIINQGICTKGVKIAGIIVKKENNDYYISLRSKSGINVAEIAKKFGGGGHENMSAFTYKGNLINIKDDFLLACKKELIKSRARDDFNLMF